MGEVLEPDGNIVQLIINDLKSSAPVWEDFLTKASKLHSALKTTVSAVDSFLDSFQRVADVANSSHGCSRDIGASLTKMVIRHRSIDFKLKGLVNIFYDLLICPLQDKLDEWKKVTIQMDRDHYKEYKKSKQELKKTSAETIKLQKKVKKGKAGHQDKLEAAMKQVTLQHSIFEEQEKRYLQKILTEERSRYCALGSCMKPVVEQEVSMMGEIAHLESILGDIVKQLNNSETLPPVGEDLVNNFHFPDGPSSWDDMTPPPSPTGTILRRPTVPGTTPLPVGFSGSSDRDPPSTPPPPPPSSEPSDPYFDAFSRHYSFSAKHKGRNRKMSAPVPPVGSPRRQPSRTSSFSVSSHSSRSSVSSIGSSGSPSIESLPPPPANMLTSTTSVVEPEPLPPPPFPGAVPATGLCVVQDRASWTTDSCCGKSSSGDSVERSMAAAQGFCPTDIPTSENGNTSSSTHHYATPYVNYSRNRCSSDSLHNSGSYVKTHCRSDSETSSHSGVSAHSVSDVQYGDLIYSDSGYFSYGGVSHHSHPDAVSINSQESAGSVGYVSPKDRPVYTRSQSLSGRPTPAQAFQLANLASHAARSRSAPMPPTRKSSAPFTPAQTATSNKVPQTVESDEEALETNPNQNSLLSQIQRQRHLIQTKAKDKVMNDIAEETR